MSDANEVERLRARVAELEAEREAAGAAGATPRRRTPRRSGWWGAASAVLIVLACVLAPVSVVSVWASAFISDTDRYVETVAPIADDPAVQDALATEITQAVFADLDVEGVTTQALETIAEQPDVPPRVATLLPTLAVPLTDGVESFTRDQVDGFLASDQFSSLWDEVNRAAHEQVVSLLEGDQGGAVSAQDDQITLNLAPLVAAVKQRLVDRGFGLASNIPDVDRSFVIAESDSIGRAQTFYSTLETLGVWLPVVALALLAAGVLLARDRRRALLKGALGLAASMVVLGAALTLFRTYYVETTPADVLTPDAAGGVFDTLVRFLRSSLRAVGVAGLVVALAAFLAGPSTAAARTRATFEHGVGSARGGAEHLGWSAGPVGAWAFRHRRALQVAVLVLAGLVLMFWAEPTAWVVVWIAVGVVVGLALVQFLATPPAAVAGPSADSPVAPVSDDQHPAPAVPRQAAAPSVEAGEPTPAASVPTSADRDDRQP